MSEDEGNYKSDYTQVDLDQCDGKTIEHIGDLYDRFVFLFTDKTYLNCLVEDGRIETKETLDLDNAWDAGIIDQSEYQRVKDYWEAQSKAGREATERDQYLRLKRKFEGKP